MRFGAGAALLPSVILRGCSLCKDRRDGAVGARVGARVSHASRGSVGCARALRRGSAEVQTAVKILRDAEASSLRKCLAAMVVWGCTAVIHADRRRKVRDSLKVPLETKIPVRRAATQCNTVAMPRWDPLSLGGLPALQRPLGHTGRRRCFVGSSRRP